MASSKQLKNREVLLACFRNALEKGRDFNINGIYTCPLAFYYEHTGFGETVSLNKRMTRWESEFVADHFGITDKQANELFALNWPQLNETDGEFHYKKISEVFTQM